MSKVDVGQIIVGEAHRDAIHVAIAPVVAQRILAPGQQVDTEGSTVGKPVGIVDPFLTRAVDKGEQFYIFLFPNTVTSLRHEWTHPDFKSPTASVAEDPKKWVASFAESIGQDYEELMSAAEQMNNRGAPTYDNSERYKTVEDSEWEKFWLCFSQITGETTTEKWAPFTCSC